MAVRKYGGAEHWAQLLGVDETRLTKRTWTDGELEEALRAFIGDRPDWPTREEFIRAGEKRLVHAVGRAGGLSVWARRLDKKFVGSRDHSPYTLDAALREAAEVIATRGDLPGVHTLAALGYGRLAWAVQRSGGAEKFRAEHGV
jgi:hypothetical protein